MSQPSSAGVPTDLMSEWDDVHVEVRGRLVGQLTALSLSRRTCEYVAGLRLYLRAPFLLTLWVPDRRLRRELTYDLVVHVVAMKLFDDLLDADTDCDRYELGICLPLWQTATESLCRRAPDPRRVLSVLRSEFMTISTGQLRTKWEPARDLPQWRAHAETYGGCFLGCYGTLAALAGGVPNACGPAGSFGHAFGMIVTVADDLRDYQRKGERSGNLANLLHSGGATVDEVVALVEELRAQAADSARRLPMAYDVGSVVDLYADDVLRRMLPAVAGG